MHPNTAREHPRVHELEENVRNGSFHSTSGKECPMAPDLREFVMPDDDQVLPEFLAKMPKNNDS